MKAILKQPCDECPFRRKHPAGWLGGYKPDEFINQIQLDGPPIPCHKTIKPNHEAKAMCAGALIFMRNCLKSSRHPDYGDALNTVSKDTENVFQWSSEFLKHHEDQEGWLTKAKQRIKS